MFKFPQLNFPPYRLKTTLRGGEPYVWDAERGCWLVLTPEEWVRQHTIRFLIEELGAHSGCIAQEFAVSFGDTTPQRADIVVFMPDMQPVMLVECKAAEVVVNSDVLAQAVRYNSVVGARYVMLTNGIKHYFYQHTDDAKYSPMSEFPQF